MTSESGQPQPPDATLLARACDGDRLAFRGLVDRYAHRLFAMAASLVGNRADAEDIVQETFAGAFRGLKAFEGRSSVRTWLTGILIRQAAMHRRRESRRGARLVPLADAPEAGLHGPSPTAVVDARIDVMAAIRELSPDHRDVIILREFEGLSYDQMAEVLGIPRGTVESRLFRARRQLQQRLKEYLD